MGRIVVGVDGSPPARAALAWAAAEARLRDATLAVRLVFEPAGPWFGVGEALGGTSAGLPTDEEMMGAARRELDDMLDGLKEAGGVPMLDAQVLMGDAASALVEESKDADLLVVGSRGHGNVFGALLGSVSTSCVHHAHCPVVVVRPEEPH